LIQYPNEFEYNSPSCVGAPSKTVPLNTECEASSDGMYVCMYDVCTYVCMYVCLYESKLTKSIFVRNGTK
jgi:hypothetical protein